MPKKNYTNIIFSFFIAFIFISSSFVYYIGNTGHDYNGFDITVNSQGSFLDFNENTIFLHLHPLEVENISISGKLNSFVNSGSFLISSDSSENYSNFTYFLSETLTDVGKQTYRGFSNEDHGTHLDVISCSNSSNNNVVVLFRDSENSSISVEDTCIIVDSEAETNSIYYLVNRVIYGILGVIDDDSQ